MSRAAPRNHLRAGIEHVHVGVERREHDILDAHCGDLAGEVRGVEALYQLVNVRRVSTLITQGSHLPPITAINVNHAQTVFVFLEFKLRRHRRGRPRQRGVIGFVAVGRIGGTGRRRDAVVIGRVHRQAGVAEAGYPRAGAADHRVSGAGNRGSFDSVAGVVGGAVGPNKIDPGGSDRCGRQVARRTKTSRTGGRRQQEDEAK